MFLLALFNMPHRFHDMMDHTEMNLITSSVMEVYSMSHQSIFNIDPQAGYFHCGNVDLISYSEYDPSQHQSGLVLLMNDRRIATCGDLRFEQTPGQFQPVARVISRSVDPENGTITVTLHYPNDSNHLRGFNPTLCPDFSFDYTVTVRAEEDSFVVTVDLDQPVPDRFLGKLCFNLELFPGILFGTPWIMDDHQGIFPRQPNGPLKTLPLNEPHSMECPEGMHADPDLLTGHRRGYNPLTADGLIAEPYAVGSRFVCRPDDPAFRFSVESDVLLHLYDGRMNHNNGWFVLSSEIPAGRTEKALTWRIRPAVERNYCYTPVIQVSQVGYLPAEEKKAYIELGKNDDRCEQIILSRIESDGIREVLRSDGVLWGDFLRYRYLVFDFSAVREEGLYRITRGSSVSSVFRIAKDVFDRGVWQPVLEYFLPVQMCHMRVNEKYRVWHGLCHMDDARMAPVNYNHFDGYSQGPSTLTRFRSGEHVPGLNAGGWHDAGDYDLRVESQAGDVYVMSLAREEFGVFWDSVTVDQQAHTVEIHQPDGKNDLLEQVEHGLLTIVGGYRALGRLYRGIICGDLRQYVLLGDASVMTAGTPDSPDERWVFTEDNPRRELTVAAQLAAASRVMKGFNDDLGAEALDIARELFEITDKSNAESAAFHAAAELLLTTGSDQYRDWLLRHTGTISEYAADCCWVASRVLSVVNDPVFTGCVRKVAGSLAEKLPDIIGKNPYHVPYRQRAWGIGWDVQIFACRYYYLHKAFPDLFGPSLLTDSLNFVLGCHPGSNTASFASGIGARSAIPAYGANRADWSYIPGGVCSGTEIIAPDFPELLEFPFLWQQLEYVLGGGSTRFMFLVLAVRSLNL